MSSKLESDVCCRLQVAPSGESHGGMAERPAGPAESNGSLLPGLWRDSLHVTCGLTACTPGSAPGPTLGNEYGKNFTFTLKTLGGSATGLTPLNLLDVSSTTDCRVRARDLFQQETSRSVKYEVRVVHDRV